MTPFTVRELLTMGVDLDTAMAIVLDVGPLKECAMTACCTECGDEYEPVEYNPAPQDPDEPRFCSDDCEVKWLEAVEAEREYRSAGDAAPVW